jgi:hypothetical protein
MAVGVVRFDSVLFDWPWLLTQLNAAKAIMAKCLDSMIASFKMKETGIGNGSGEQK